MNIVDRYQNNISRELKIDFSSSNEWASLIANSPEPGQVTVSNLIDGSIISSGTIRETQWAMLSDSISYGTISARYIEPNIRIQRRCRLRLDDGTTIECSDVSIEMLGEN